MANQKVDPIPDNMSIEEASEFWDTHSVANYLSHVVQLEYIPGAVRMIRPTYLSALRKIYVRLNDGGVNWAITGSLGFALQGVPVEVHDIDIQTDEAGAYEIERRFSEFIIRKVAFSSADKIRSHFGGLMIDGVKVEIMGDIQKRLADGTWEARVDLKCHQRMVSVEGMGVPVLSLAYEYQAYLKLGRIDRAEMLRKWLHGERHSGIFGCFRKSGGFG